MVNELSVASTMKKWYKRKMAISFGNQRQVDKNPLLKKTDV